MPSPGPPSKLATEASGPKRDRAFCIAQFVGWAVAVELAAAQTAGLLPGDGLGPVWLAVLSVAPIVWWVRTGTVRAARDRSRPTDRARAEGTLSTNPETAVRPWLLAAAVGVIAFGTSYAVAVRIGDVPPGSHDAYSYLFQAETYLRGRLWFPSHPRAPALFDQVHVLNEGKFASRYFPGTGLWIAPFLWLGKPYWGHWLANGICAALIFAAGRELGGTRIGLPAGLVTAFAPGMALFSNTLAAHHPTLVGLSLFLVGFLRWKRQGSCRWLLTAGTGLGFAMLCRPLTAVAVVLPFGLQFCGWLFANDPRPRAGQAGARLQATAILAAPLALAMGFMMVHNRAITGSAWMPPYQLYTNIYTPSHVYGFNNVVRGRARYGPEVDTDYDRWAENLTLRGAAANTVQRLYGSWLWTVSPVPVAAAGIIMFLTAARFSREIWLLAASIASLHAAYFGYWFVGSLGMHYVFESIPLWGLLFAAVSVSLVDWWRRTGHAALPAWWGLLVLGLLVNVHVPGGLMAGSHLDQAIDELASLRKTYAKFNKLVDEHVRERPALVLVEQPPVDFHVDFVVNEPDLQSDVLIGRYRPDAMSLKRIANLFPERTLYVFRERDWRLKRVAPDGPAPVHKTALTR